MVYCCTCRGVTCRGELHWKSRRARKNLLNAFGSIFKRDLVVQLAEILLQNLRISYKLTGGFSSYFLDRQ